ncbi:hypothetical protein BIFDEN_00563 [Bifidobacterium dentium ATCC 27678]|nr:hypothetical protein BIFDEN_00563 [Bifidobacterium dentium ATCC 27678]
MHDRMSCAGRLCCLEGIGAATLHDNDAILYNDVIVVYSTL